MMFEALTARAEAAARRRARERARALAEALGAVPGIRAEIGPEGVSIAGRGLARRLVREPELRRRIGGWR